MPSKTLFKFVGSQSAVRAMARGSLKFTPVFELNDPSELVPMMNRDSVAISLAVLRQHGYTPAAIRMVGLPRGSASPAFARDARAVAATNHSTCQPDHSAPCL